MVIYGVPWLVFGFNVKLSKGPVEKGISDKVSYIISSPCATPPTLHKILGFYETYVVGCFVIANCHFKVLREGKISQVKAAKKPW